MKYFKSFLLLIALLCVGISNAQTFEYNGIHYYVHDDWNQEVTVTSNPDGWGYSGDIDIPYEINQPWGSYRVTAIGSSAFCWCSEITSVTLPYGITRIESCAFQGCSGLSSVTLPESLTDIDWSAFESCSSLTSINLPKDLLRVGGYAFANCTSLVEITFPAGLTNIEQNAFDNCTSLTSIELPSGLTQLGTSVFKGCTELTSLKVVDGNSQYDSRNNCNAIIETETNTLVAACKTTEIPVDVKSIGSYAFHGLNGLTTLQLPNGVESICSHAFQECSGLTSVKFPEGLTSIGANAFEGCSELMSVELPKGLAKIESGIFSGCSKLSAIKVVEGNPTYDSRNNCNAIIETATNTLILGCKTTVIPQDVVSIGSSAFYGCSGLTSVTLPNGIKSIGSSAFQSCSGLTSMEFPDGLLSVDASAFSYCSQLDQIKLPSNIENIGNNAFYGTSWWNKQENGLVYLGEWLIGRKNMDLNGAVVIKDGTKGIASGIFSWSNLTSISLPKGLTRLGTGTFSYCRNLSSVNIPEGLKQIEDNAFSNCSQLTSFSLPTTLTSIGKNAFESCSQLTSVVLPTNLNNLGEGAFKYCYNLTTISLPNGFDSIQSRTFYGCTKLSNVIIPEGVVSVGEYSFYGCDSLKTVTLPQSIARIDEYALNSCDTVIIEGFQPAQISSPFKTNATLYVPTESFLTYIKADGWKGYADYITCYGYANLSIEAFAKSTGSGVMEKIGIDLLRAVRTLKVTGSINSYDMIVFRDKMINLHTLDLSAATVEASTTPYIGSNTTSTNDLGANAFNGFTRFKVIKLPKNLEKISAYAFTGCTNLTSVEIPSTVKSIGADAFYNCRQLTDVVIPDYVQKIESRAFYACQALDTLRLPNALQDIESSAFYNCTGLKSVVLPQTMNTIGSKAFSECSSIDTITMPKSLTSIGTGAFSYCRSLKTINIPQDLKSLPDGGSYSGGVFYGCTSLVSVSIPEGLEKIGTYAFYNCSKLNNVMLPPGLTSIGSSAFSDCYGLISVMLPPTVTVIGSNAFHSNSSLTEIRIPASVTSIGESAFSGCSKLGKVYTYTVEPTSIAENTFDANTYKNATLYVPAVSYFNYYWDKGWKRFLNLASFDEPYEYFYVNNDYVLDENTGYIEGEDGKVPDADINAGGGLVVEGEQTDDDEPHQNLGNVNVGHNGGNNCGSIIGDNNLHVDKLNIRINVTGNKWYFFSFPFDVKRSDIKMQNGSDFVFRYYDGEERAQHGHGGWKDMKDEDFHAGRGFIFQSSATDVLIITVSDVRFKKDNKQNDLNAYVSDNLKDASWNFVGNPYLSYYDMEDMDYTAPITRWDGSKYVAMRPGDDLYHFAPCEAFFVQKPEGKEHIGYDGKKQMTANQSNAKKQEVGQAQKLNTTFGVERERFLINLVLGNDAETDQTRVVFNELQTMDYETACDAAKFETKGVTQIYTLDSRKVRYAINERPKADGVVPVGFSVNESGSYTIEAKRMDIHVILMDNETGVVHNLSEGAYTFSTDAGTYETRFTLMLEGADVTGVESVKLSDVLNAGTPVYDLGGRLVRPVKGGVYIIDGVKVRMK